MNINASNTNFLSSSYNFTTTAKSSTEETTNEEMTSIQAATTSIGANQSQDGDSVEISTDALAALESEDEEETSTAEVLASAAQDATSSSDSSNDLSSYTESQLKDMVNSGEISQSQYNAEIASRTADEESVEEKVAQTEQSATSGVEKAMMAQMHIDISL